jgi:hypothetical protein
MISDVDRLMCHFGGNGRSGAATGAFKKEKRVADFCAFQAIDITLVERESGLELLAPFSV